jgi:folate-binding Fe-S cluster repair protein YgfZ
VTTVVLDGGIDTGAPWHFGDPMREQRLLDQGEGVVDLSHRGVVTVSGRDRLTWLHSLTTQHLDALEPGVGVTSLVLSPQGHIEHVLYGVDDGETFWAHTEPGAAAPMAAWLDRMRFLMRVEVTDRTDAYALVWTAGHSGNDDGRPGRAGLPRRA